MSFAIRSRRTIILIAALLTLVAASVCQFYSVTQYTCLQCRATLTERHIFGVRFPWVSHGPDSTPLLTRYPGHPHSWCWCGSRRSYSLSSITRGCGRQHPIWRLPIRVQAAYAQLVPAPELQKTLHALDSADRFTADTIVDRVCERVLNHP